MTIEGRIHRVGDHVNTDLIIAGRYCHLPSDEMAPHVFEDLDPTFVTRFEAGGVLVAGLNFGCGSSREEAPATLKAAGVALVVAPSFARIFFRNCINIGLPIVESAEAAAGLTEGGVAVLDDAGGLLTDLATGQSFRVPPFPAFMQDLVARGGLMADARARLAARKGGS